MYKSKKDKIECKKLSLSEAQILMENEVKNKKLKEKPFLFFLSTI